MAGDSRLSARFGSDTSDFKNGLNEINRELKVVESGFRASASALGDWSDSATGLEMRIGALNEKIDLQKEKVDALRYRYEELKAAHGENSVEAKNAEIALNKETEMLHKMENELKDTTGALQKMGSQANQTGNQVKESGAKFKGFSDVIAGARDIIKNASVVISGVGVIIKKALDFGEQGAQIVQVEESYNSLMEQIGASADVLDRLSAAARGTIDEGDLMAATMKMLTGTSEELSLALVENAPALMEIAKASNKLNPTMGSTLELYEAMSTSIKNLAPKGLKQVGIVIDSTAAYAEYAQSIGKAVNALTEEEQSMALMNATLLKGKDILKQVGGNTEAATDKFIRANIAINNLKETIMVKLVPALGNVATGLSLILGSTDIQEVTTAWGDFFNRLITSGASATEIVDAYKQKQLEVNKVFSTSVKDIRAQGDEVDLLAKLWVKLTQDESKFLSDQPGLQRALLTVTKSSDEYWRAMVRMAGGDADLVDQNNWIVQAFKARAQAAWDAAHGISAVERAEIDLRSATENYIIDIDRSGLSALGFQKVTVGLTKDLQAMQFEGFTAAEAWSEYQKALADADQKAQELRQTLGEDLVTAIDNVQQAQQNWMSGAAGDIAAKLKDWLGTGKRYREGIAAIDEVFGTSLVNQQAYLDAVSKLQSAYAKTGDLDAFKKGLSDLRDEFMPTDDAVVAAQEKVKNLQDQLDTLSKTEVVVPVTINVGKVNVAPGVLDALQNIGGSGSGDHRIPTTPTPPRGYARGGGGIVPPGYPDDSYLIGLTSGEAFFVGALAQAQQNINAAMAGMNLSANVNVAGAGGAGAVAGAGITFTGDIIVNGAPGMNEEILAQKVVDKIGDTLEVARSKGLR